ncbi:Immediate early response 3-interacting protein 1 [Trichoplax sp. H2]|uniref:Immediate early response 3-interacting protein 1 n=1 Tax=Trichoplax adhaerens TaxID=10228 RepID=B3RSL6_TRIAD|nr:hypothetical protein TRIADDRAFT_54645 [Trichoplax adhaerens]EDV27079.1 hypothetical protein TRIADDRAFT_54645 [Trichoplax adhaerens]RDD37193.1 Immediate early response 3-interacting protein 1 [Trichoplax sp. H2]|eukprot:XP_002111075.1 hypothetical protein TRIADDRAFT_54645 [Trichoplax adhaerens]
MEGTGLVALVAKPVLYNCTTIFEPALPLARTTTGRRKKPWINQRPMAFTLYALLEAALLCINAIAILNEERFLAKVGWSSSQPQGYGEEEGVKSKLMNVIKSVQTLLRSEYKE